MPKSHRPRTPLLLFLLALGACREGESSPFPVVPLPASSDGANGCNGPNQTFAGAPVAVTLSGVVLGSASQMVASLTGPELFVTGDGATVYRLDFSAGVGVAPTEEALVDAFPQPPGVVAAPVLSGIAVLSPGTLVVADLASNALWSVDRFVTNGVAHYAGAIDEAGGFADGVGSQAAFDFDRPASLISTGDGWVLVAEPANQALRAVFPDTLPQVATLAGFTGMAGGLDGTVFEATFDEPTGLSVSCLGELLVTEASGMRLRSVELGPPGFGGNVRTLVDAPGTPAGAASSSQGEVYWIDSGAGALRRFDLGSGVLDSPVGGFSTSGGSFSVAVLNVGGTDHLFVLDADAGTLSRVTP